jgi:hypothetical protein
MPSLNTRVPAFTPQRIFEATYEGFSGGLNLFYKPTEIKKNELVKADNCMLIGKGVVTSRWGSETFFQAGSGDVKYIDVYNNIDTGTRDLLALTDAGYLVKKSGASYSIIAGASYASGCVASFTQIGNYEYIASSSNNLSRYDGTNISTYTAISRPTISGGASYVSGVSGTAVWSYKVTAFSTTGETLPSAPVYINYGNFDREKNIVNLAWTQPSTASTAITGFGIYTGLAGEETLIATVGPTVRSIVDNGLPLSSTFTPSTDSTGGVKAKYIKRFDDRLILAGIDNDPTMVMISGKYPYQDRFNWQNGGGYIKVAPDSGDEITGIEVVATNAVGASLSASILVFMKNSIHQVVLSYVTVGNYSILNPTVQQISVAGASNFKGITNIQNNTFYFGNQGLQTVGPEANYFNILRTREVSERIRPFVDSLDDIQISEVCAGYMDYKYLFSFKSLKQTMVYDYQRGCFMGTWQTPFGITSWFQYTDDNGNFKYLAGCDDGVVREFNSLYLTDSGTPITKLMTTKKEPFDNWSVLKVVRQMYLLFRNVTGTVSVNIVIEQRDGTPLVIAKSFEVAGTSGGTGWGTDLWGSHLWGQSNQEVQQAEPDDTIRWLNLYKTARTIQVEIIQTTGQSNFEFAEMKMSATFQPEGSISSSLRI